MTGLFQSKRSLPQRHYQADDVPGALPDRHGPQQIDLEKYTEMIVDIALNPKKGESILIEAHPDQKALIDTIQLYCKERGNPCEVLWLDPLEERRLILNARSDSDLRVQENMFEAVKRCVASGGYRLKVMGYIDPYYLSPSSYKGRKQQRKYKIRKQHLAAVWKLIVAAADEKRLKRVFTTVPTSGWAKKAFPELADQSDLSLRRLNRFFEQFLLLDQSDPVGAYRDHLERLTEKRKELTRRRYKDIFVRGSSTELSMKLSPVVSWLGGYSEEEDGTRYVPNFPTNDIYVTPDFRTVRGPFTVNQPFPLMREPIVGFRGEFGEGGKLSKWNADSGKEVIEMYLQKHPRAYYLGELGTSSQMTGVLSPEFRAKHVGIPLVDENLAPIHLAFGSGFPEAFPDSDPSLEEDELLALGCNVSDQHQDIPISDDGLVISGKRRGTGNEEIIFADQEFVI